MDRAKKLAARARSERRRSPCATSRRGEPRPRDAVRRRQFLEAVAVRHHRVVRRHARRHHGVSREAQAAVQGEVIAPSSCGDCDRRLALQRFRHRAPARGARAALARRRRSPTTTSRCFACRARSRFRWRRSAWPRPDKVDAVVCLGCLIRGETPHFEYIASACAHGITAAAASTGVPMSFGVLTTNSAEEALERARRRATNKGREAADAALEMAAVSQRRRRSATGRPRQAIAMGPAAPRARGGAAGPLSKWECGGRGPAGAGRAASTPDRRVDDLGERERDSPCAGARRDGARARRSTSASPMRRSNWRVERMAVLDRLVCGWRCTNCWRIRDARRVGHRRGDRAGPRYSGEDAAKFVNGVLDGVFAV